MRSLVIALFSLLPLASSSFADTAPCGEFMKKFVQAQKDRDVEAFVSLFAPDYISFQPRAPQNTFRGNDKVRLHWTAIFSLGLKQTGVRDFKAETGFCVEEKSADGASHVKFNQVWRGGFDAQGQNPCLDEPVFMDFRVENGKATSVEIYFVPEIKNKILSCALVQ